MKIKARRTAGAICLSYLDGALIGAGSGIASGLVGRVILACNPEIRDLQEGTVDKVLFRVLGCMSTLGFNLASQFAFYALDHWGKMRVSIHNVTSEN